MASNQPPYDPDAIRHVPAYRSVIEQWETGLRQDDALDYDPLRYQLNPAHIGRMVGITRSRDILFKILVLTRDGSDTSQERALAIGAVDNEGRTAQWIGGRFPRRVVEQAIYDVAPRGRWPTYSDGERAGRWIRAMRKLFGKQFDEGADYVVGWAVANG